MESGNFRLLVLGAGAMGSNHLRVLERTRLCDLAVFDPTLDYSKVPSSVEQLSKAPEPKAFDGVVIATSSPTHFSLAMEVLSSSTAHVLIEKPLVTSAEELEPLAAYSDRIRVGHVERFNPVAQSLIDDVDWGQVVHVRAQRMGGAPNGKTPLDPFFDLAIHDLDLIGFASRSTLSKSGHVFSVRSRNNEVLDCSVHASFTGGHEFPMTADASYLAMGKNRTISIREGKRLLVYDLVLQRLSISHLLDGKWDDWTQVSLLRGGGGITVETRDLPSVEPLHQQALAFLGELRSGGQSPILAKFDEVRNLMQSMYEYNKIEEPKHG